LAKLILNGATSGSISIESPAVSGTTTLTLPATSGTVGIVSGDLGTPSALVGTNITGTANALNAGIGVNQTWQTVTGSRSLATTYTNTTGKPILVQFRASVTGGARATMSGTVDSLTIGFLSTDAISSVFSGSFTLLVPPSSSYSVQYVSGTATSYAWFELS
jgi:hypothetical protein